MKISLLSPRGVSKKLQFTLNSSFSQRIKPKPSIQQTINQANQLYDLSNQKLNEFDPNIPISNLNLDFKSRSTQKKIALQYFINLTKCVQLIEKDEINSRNSSKFFHHPLIFQKHNTWIEYYDSAQQSEKQEFSSSEEIRCRGSKFLKKKNWNQRLFNHLEEQQDEEINQTAQEIPIVTISGSLGLVTRWEKLQETVGNHKYRWIHFLMPGTDSGPVIRGNYNGHVEQCAELLKNLLDELGVEKCVLNGQCIGGLVMNTFIYRYPEKVAGIIYNGAFVNPIFTEATGTFFSNSTAKDLMAKKILFNYQTQNLLEHIYDQKKQEYEKQFEGELFNYPLQKYIASSLIIHSYCYNIWKEMVQKNYELPESIPKMFMSGIEDPVIQWEENTQHMFYELITKKSNVKIEKHQKKYLEDNYPELYQKYSFSNSNKNQVVLLNNNAHMLFDSHTKLISKPFEQFVTLCQALQLNEKEHKKLSIFKPGSLSIPQLV